MAEDRVNAPQLDRLELTIRRLLDAHDALKRRAEQAERRVRELETTVQELAEGGLDPAALAEQVRALEVRNRDLRERLDRAHAVVERLRARLQFAEEEV